MYKKILNDGVLCQHHYLHNTASHVNQKISCYFFLSELTQSGPPTSNFSPVRKNDSVKAVRQFPSTYNHSFKRSLTRFYYYVNTHISPNPSMHPAAKNSPNEYTLRPQMKSHPTRSATGIDPAILADDPVNLFGYNFFRAFMIGRCSLA